MASRYTDVDDLGRITRAGEISDDGRDLWTTYHYQDFSLIHDVAVMDDPTNTTTYGYDVLGRQANVTKPDSGLRIFTYDAFGQATSTTDAMGNTTVFDRDEAGRVHHVTDQSGTATIFWDDSPHGVGKSTGSSSVDGVTTEAQFDTFGRPTQQTYGLGTESFVTSTSYDGAGRLLNLTYPDTPGYTQLVLSHGYDSHGALKSVTNVATSEVLWSIGDGQAREPSGRVNIEHLGANLFSIRSHDALNNFLTGVSTTYEVGGQQTSLQDDSFTYYPNGSLESRTTDSDTVETFGYDALNRLQDWDGGARGWHVTYQYGDDGNLTNRIRTDRHADDLTFNYGEGGAGRHALSSTTWGAYQYDLAGRQTTAPGRSITSYTNLDLPRAATTSQGLTTFAYDASGARLEKQSPVETEVSIGTLYQRVTARQTGGAEHLLYVYNDERVIATIRRAGGTETTEFQQTDNVGTPTATFNGDVVTRTFTDPFGNITSIDDPKVPGSGQSPTGHGLGEHELDADLGIINFGGRLYDPAVGRFLTPDPIVGDALSLQGFNPYSLAFNNPTSFQDPSGYQATGLDTGSSMDVTGTTTYAEQNETKTKECLGVGGGCMIYSPSAPPMYAPPGKAGCNCQGTGGGGNGQGVGGGGGSAGGKEVGASDSNAQALRALAGVGPYEPWSGATNYDGTPNTRGGMKGPESGEPELGPGVPGQGTGSNEPGSESHALEGADTANRHFGLPIALSDLFRTLAEEGNKELQEARQVLVNGRPYSYDAFKGEGSEMRSLVNTAKNSQAATLRGLKSLGHFFQAFVWGISIWNCFEHGFSKRSIVQLDVAAGFLLLTPIMAPVAVAALAATLIIMDATGISDSIYSHIDDHPMFTPRSLFGGGEGAEPP
jgi:RHS repeat-associated protein